MRVVKSPTTTNPAEEPEESDYSENTEDAVATVEETTVVSGDDDDKLYAKRWAPDDEDAGAKLQQIQSLLNQPLDKLLIKQRQGAFGKDLDYLEWHTVVRQLNRIFGVNKWETNIQETKTYGTDEKSGVPKAVTVTMTLEIRFPTGYSQYTNVGVGVTTPRKDGSYTWDAFEMAYKGAAHDALKRCATALGDQFGLSLYAKEEKVKEERVKQNQVAPTPSRVNPQSAPAFRAQQQEGEDDESSDATAACEECGNEIRGYTHSKTGRIYTTTDLVNISKRKHNGRTLCYNCGLNA